jgi:spore coat protein U-like protein
MRDEREAMTMKRLLIGFAVLVAGALLPSAASAQSPSCTITTLSVNFGNYNVFTTTPDDSTGRVTYRCNSTAFNITVALTQGASSTFNPRLMYKGVEVLGYNLYRNSARTTIWGDGTGGTAVYSRADPPNNSNVNVTIYGRIPAGQDVSAGTFSDTVTAVINF